MSVTAQMHWLQTVPGKGWWTILRLYCPLVSFFDKTWRPTEIQKIYPYQLVRIRSADP